jgi:hypothetical protein
LTAGSNAAGSVTVMEVVNIAMVDDIRLKALHRISHNHGRWKKKKTLPTESQRTEQPNLLELAGV